MYSKSKMSTADKLLLERLTLREVQLSQHADGIDAKAALLLVAATFLAGQTAYLLNNHARGFLHWEQVGAGITEFIAGGLLAWLLRIQWYSNEAAEDYPKWRDGLVKEAGSDMESIEAQMISEIIEGLTSRCATAYEINFKKSKILEKAHWITLMGFGLNCIALVALAGVRICFVR